MTTARLGGEKLVAVPEALPFVVRKRLPDGRIDRAWSDGKSAFRTEGEAEARREELEAEDPGSSFVTWTRANLVPKAKGRR